MFLSGCISLFGHRVDVQVTIPFLQDYPIDVVLMALKPDGTTVVEPMVKKGTEFQAVMTIDPGIWSLSVDLTYQGYILNSIVLAPEVLVEKDTKKLRFDLPDVVATDELFGEISVPDLVKSGEKVTIKTTGTSDQVQWRLVYQPEGSAASLDSATGREVSLECDREGVYVVEAYALSRGSYGLQYVYINCVVDMIWIEEKVKEADFHDGAYFVLTESGAFYRVSENEKTRLASSLKVVQFLLYDNGSKVGLVANDKLYLWDITVDTQIAQISPSEGQRVDKVFFITEEGILANLTDLLGYSGELYVYRYEGNWVKANTYTIYNMTVVPGTELIIATVPSGFQLYRWKKDTASLLYLGSVFVPVKAPYSIWSLLNGTFVDNTGTVAYLNSRLNGVIRAKDKIFSDAEPKSVEQVGSETIWGLQGQSVAYLRVTDAYTLEEKYTIDLPVFTTDGEVSLACTPLACGASDEQVSCLIDLAEENKALIVFYRRWL